MTQAQAPSAGSPCTAPPSTTPTTSSAVTTRGLPPSSWRSGPPNRAPPAAVRPKGPPRLAAVKTKGPRRLSRQRCSWQRTLWQPLDRPMWGTPLPTSRAPSAKTQVGTTVVCLCIRRTTGQHHTCLLVICHNAGQQHKLAAQTPALSPPPLLLAAACAHERSACFIDLGGACLVGLLWLEPVWLGCCG